MLIQYISKLLCGRHSASIIFFININFVLYFTRIDILILFIFIRIKITKMIVYKFLKLFGIWILFIFFFVIFHHFVNSIGLDSILILFFFFRLIKSISKLLCGRHSASIIFFININFVLYFTRIDILILLIFIRIKVTKMIVHKFLKLFGIWILSIFFFVIFHHFVYSIWLDSILSLFKLFIHELRQLCCCWLSSIM